MISRFKSRTTRHAGLARAALILVLALAAGCSNDDPVGHEHDDVFRVAVAIGPDEIAAAGHLPISAGQQNRVSFNLYNDHGGRIQIVDHFQLSVSFTPTTLASAAPVAGTTTSFDITSSAASDTEGTMHVTIYHPHTEVTKTFGPYDVLIH